MKWLFIIIAGIFTGIVTNMLGLKSSDMMFWVVSTMILLPANICIFIYFDREE